MSNIDYESCWCELKSFFKELNEESSDDFPYVSDILLVMALIERKFDD